MGMTALFLLPDGGSDIALLNESLLMKLVPFSLPIFLSSLRFFEELS
jgi:hypothetical protein